MKFLFCTLALCVGLSNVSRVRSQRGLRSLQGGYYKQSSSPSAPPNTQTLSLDYYKQSSSPSAPPNTQILSLDVTDICQGRSGSCHVNYDDPPATCGDSCPIVFFLHGLNGDADVFHYMSKTNENDVIGVYPQGDVGWNTGMSNELHLDDIGFIASIISKFRSMNHNGNVFAIGSGTGGEFAYMLAANADDNLPIKGIVVKSMSLLSTPSMHGTANTVPTEGRDHVSVLQLMGTNDPLVSINGGSTNLYSSYYYSILSADDSIFQWANHNNCGEAEVENVFTDVGTATASVTSYDCQDTVVKLVKLEGVGHNTGTGSIQAIKIDYDYIYGFIHSVDLMHTTNTTETTSPPPAPSTLEQYCQDNENFQTRSFVGTDYVTPVTCTDLRADTSKCGFTDDLGMTGYDECLLACSDECEGIVMEEDEQANMNQEKWG